MRSPGRRPEADRHGAACMATIDNRRFGTDPEAGLRFESSPSKAQCCDKSTRDAHMLLEHTMIATQPIIIAWLMTRLCDYPDYSMAGSDWRFAERLDDSWFASTSTSMGALPDASVQSSSRPPTPAKPFLLNPSVYVFSIASPGELSSERYASDPMVLRIVSPSLGYKYSFCRNSPERTSSSL